MFELVRWQKRDKDSINRFILQPYGLLINYKCKLHTHVRYKHYDIVIYIFIILQARREFGNAKKDFNRPRPFRPQT